jgi:hypothetical protein
MVTINIEAGEKKEKSAHYKDSTVNDGEARKAQLNPEK